MATAIKAKKRCCKDGPRCKRCPVVLKKLEKAGFAERETARRYSVGKVPKKALKVARSR